MTINDPTKIPNFFIVGAAKSGTTSLYHCLNQHPDVYMSPIKEPHYFCKDIRCNDFSASYRNNVCLDVKKYLKKSPLEKKHIAYIDTIEEYLQLYRDAKDEKVIGEISNGYLYSSVASNEIYHFNNDAKVVMVLRNPIERAFSHWKMDLRGNDVYRKSFIGAIEDDLMKTDKGWGRSHLYIELGLYYEQVKRYMDLFPKNQILIFLYEDLDRSPNKFYTELFNFLKIPPSSLDTKKRHNAATIPAYPTLNYLIRKTKVNYLAAKILPKKMKQIITESISTTDKLPELMRNDIEELKKYFSSDIDKLQQLINRDLSFWIK